MTKININISIDTRAILILLLLLVAVGTAGADVVRVGSSVWQWPSMAGSGDGLVKVDSNGNQTRENIDGYVSGDVFLCYNSTAGVYGC